MARPGRRPQLELAVEAAAVLERHHVGRDLQLVHEAFVQPRRTAGRQNVRHHVERGVALPKGLHGVPHIVHPRHLHAVFEGRGHVRIEPHDRWRPACHRRTAGNVAEVPLRQPACLARSDVARDGDGRVVGGVVRAEEPSHVFDRRRRQVRHRPDHRPVIRVIGRIEPRQDVLLRQPVGPVLVTLATLVLHHAALQVDLVRGDLGQQEAEPVRVQPQHQRERVTRPAFVIVRAVFGGGPVVVRARGLEQAIELPRGHVLRAHEHDVLEQVREPGAPGLLVRRAHMEPGVHRYHRNGMIFVQDHLEAVRKRERLVRNAERLGGESDCRTEAK